MMTISVHGALPRAFRNCAHSHTYCSCQNVRLPECQSVSVSVCQCVSVSAVRTMLGAGVGRVTVVRRDLTTWKFEKRSQCALGPRLF